MFLITKEELCMKYFVGYFDPISGRIIVCRNVELPAGAENFFKMATIGLLRAFRGNI